MDAKLTLLETKLTLLETKLTLLETGWLPPLPPRWHSGRCLASWKMCGRMGASWPAHRWFAANSKDNCVRVSAWFHIVCDRYTLEYAHFTYFNTIWPLSLSSGFGSEVYPWPENLSYVPLCDPHIRKAESVLFLMVLPMKNFSTKNFRGEGYLAKNAVFDHFLRPPPLSKLRTHYSANLKARWLPHGSFEALWAKF